MSDSDDDSSSSDSDLSDEDNMKETLKAEGKTPLQKWIELGKGLDWRNEFPDLELPDNVEIDPLVSIVPAENLI